MNALRKAIERAPSLSGKWKKITIQHLERARAKLDTASKSKKAGETIRLFKAGMADFSIAATTLSDQMRESEKTFRVLMCGSAAVAVSALILDIALAVKASCLSSWTGASDWNEGSTDCNWGMLVLCGYANLNVYILE